MSVQVSGESIGKRFNRNWLFRKINFSCETGESLAILGNNGSGKSTLLKIISGVMPPSEGQLTYRVQNHNLYPDRYYRHISFVAPYMELPEELTLAEFLNFHTRFKPLVNGFTIQNLLHELRFQKAANQPLSQFSSGMKQRLKLGIALHAQTPVLLLDEPCTNLDDYNIAWYRDTVRNLLSDKIVIISSNAAIEYDFCEKQLSVQNR